MKKIVMIFAALFMMMFASTAFAKDATWMQEGYDFPAAQSALIDSLSYVPNKTDALTPDEIYQAIIGEMKESLFIKTRDAVQYQAVLAEKNISLDTLDKKTAKQVYADNLNGYVDIRIVPTLINKARPILFIDVFDVATNTLVYSNHFDDGKGNSVEMYQNLTNEFCKEFNKIMKREKFKK